MRHVLSCLTFVCVSALVPLGLSSEAFGMGRGASARVGGVRFAAAPMGRFHAGRFNGERFHGERFAGGRFAQYGARGAFVDRGYRPSNGRLPDLAFPRFGDPSRFQQVYGLRGCGRGSARCYDTGGLYGYGPAYGSSYSGLPGYGPGRTDYGGPVAAGIPASPVQPAAIYVISGNGRATASGRRGGATGPVSASSDNAGQDSVVASAAPRTARVIR